MALSVPEVVKKWMKCETGGVEQILWQQVKLTFPRNLIASVRYSTRSSPKQLIIKFGKISRTKLIYGPKQQERRYPRKPPFPRTLPEKPMKPKLENYIHTGLLAQAARSEPSHFPSWMLLPMAKLTLLFITHMPLPFVVPNTHFHMHSIIEKYIERKRVAASPLKPQWIDLSYLSRSNLYAHSDVVILHLW